MSETTDATPESSYEFPGLHHVQLAIPPGGEELARRYYGEILGMTELEKPPVLAARGGCWFRSTGLEIHLGVEKDFRAAAKAHPGILVKDLDAPRRPTRIRRGGRGVGRQLPRAPPLLLSRPSRQPDRTAGARRMTSEAGVWTVVVQKVHLVRRIDAG